MGVDHLLDLEVHFQEVKERSQNKALFFSRDMSKAFYEINTPIWEEEKNLMKKAKVIMYVGIIVVSVALFFGTAVAIDAAMDAIYYNTSLIDWFYDSDLYSAVMIGLCLIPSFEAYSRMKRVCGLH